MKIINIKSAEVLDSRGMPTIETYVMLQNNIIGHAIIPSGISKGKTEAIELRDLGNKRYNGMGVLQAVKNVNEIIKNNLIGLNPQDQEKIDQIMIDLDGKNDKSKLGANAILSVSLATMKAAAMANGQMPYEYLKKKYSHTNFNKIPLPMINIINGGMHADNRADIQEFMIVPVGAKTVQEALQISAETIYALKKIIKKNNHSVNVGDEGGFAPSLQDNEEALKYIVSAIESAGYIPGKDISIALDVAASSFYKNNGEYLFENKTISSFDMIEYYEKLCAKYPIISIEDGMAENDYSGWEKLIDRLGNKINIVGDDLFTTNPSLLSKYTNLANSILIKCNQIGTLTETMQTIQLARKNNYKIIISHRSGETEDTTISHLAFGIGSDYIKSGSICRSERVAKYNEMLRIERDINKF